MSAERGLEKKTPESPTHWGSPKPELWGLDKLLSNSSPISWLHWVHIKSPSFFVVSFLFVLVLCARLVSRSSVQTRRWGSVNRINLAVA